MKRNFKNKVVIITGASGNLGRAICKRFGQAGAQIVALDLNTTLLTDLEAELKKEQIKVLSIACDITNKKSCQGAIEQVLSTWGRIDGLVNNAGITHIERYTQMDKTKEITRRVMEVNFFGAVNCTEVVLEQICQQKGVFINISSVAGFAPLLGRTAYAASKHALHGFFESLRTELQEEGVHCMMVCPSFIQAPAKGKAADIGKNAIYQQKKTIGKSISADEIAKDIFAYCLANKPLLIAGKTGKISYWLHRFFPKIYERAMIKRLKHDI